MSNQRLLTAIGQVASSWAALEQEIRIQCWKLEQYEPSGSVRPNVILTDIHTRFKLIRQFWYRLTLKSYPEKESQINNINMGLVTLSPDRDLVIHCTWRIVPRHVDLSYTHLEQKDGKFRGTVMSSGWNFLEDLPVKIDSVKEQIANL